MDPGIADPGLVPVGLDADLAVSVENLKPFVRRTGGGRDTA